MVPRRATKCMTCNEPFRPGSSYISHFDEKSLQRLDFCPTCFEEETREGSFWQGTLPEKKIVFSSEDEKALALLQQLIEEKKENYAYALALYLERKGVLAARKKDRLFEHIPSGELFIVKKQPIDKELLAELETWISVS